VKGERQGKGLFNQEVSSASPSPLPAPFLPWLKEGEYMYNGTTMNPNQPHTQTSHSQPSSYPLPPARHKATHDPQSAYAPKTHTLIHVPSFHPHQAPSTLPRATSLPPRSLHRGSPLLILSRQSCEKNMYAERGALRRILSFFAFVARGAFRLLCRLALWIWVSVCVCVSGWMERGGGGERLSAGGGYEI